MPSHMIIDRATSIGQQFMSSIQQVIAQFENASQVEQYVGELTYFEIMISLTVAALLGAFLAYHPKRNLELSGPVSDRELRKTQIVICVAGAVMVALIQGSLERAFGLVGLGSFVRYRTALRNPYDLAIIFILIGLGMACGLQHYEFAVTITGFIYVLMYLLELKAPEKRDIWTYKIETSDPDYVEKVFRQIAKEKSIRINLIKTNKENRRFHCKFTAKQDLDTDEINALLKERCGTDIDIIRFDWEQKLRKR